MTDAPTVVHLDTDELVWGEHAIAGAEQPARIVLLHADPERSTRTVVVQFPDGWTRDAVGHQPAAEEMVLLSGALSISGLTCAPGQILVVEPKATRAATSTLDDTRALVFFSGAGGGWEDGEAADAGSAAVHDLASGFERGPRTGLNGTVEFRTDVAGTVLGTDADVFWPQAHAWAYVPAGSAVPDLDGDAVVHTWS